MLLYRLSVIIMLYHWLPSLIPDGHWVNLFTEFNVIWLLTSYAQNFVDKESSKLLARLITILISVSYASSDWSYSVNGWQSDSMHWLPNTNGYSTIWYLKKTKVDIDFMKINSADLIEAPRAVWDRQIVGSHIWQTVYMISCLINNFM